MTGTQREAITVFLKAAAEYHVAKAASAKSVETEREAWSARYTAYSRVKSEFSLTTTGDGIDDVVRAILQYA